MMTRGLPLEQAVDAEAAQDLAEDVAFMNKMVDEIIAERRKQRARRPTARRTCSAP